MTKHERDKLASLPTDEYPPEDDEPDRPPTFEAIGREMGITGPAVFRLFRRGLTKLKGICEHIS